MTVGEGTPLPPERVAKRTRIVELWRKHMGHPDNVGLAGSDQEWAFWEALMDEGVAK